MYQYFFSFRGRSFLEILHRKRSLSQIFFFARALSIPFCLSPVRCPDGEPDQGPQRRAGQHLQRRVSQGVPERAVVGRWVVWRQLRQDDVEHGSLPPGVEPHSGGIVHHHPGDDDCDRELRARRSGDCSQSRGQSGDGAGVGRRHPSTAHQPGEVPSPLLAVEGEDFEGLGDGEGREGGDERAGGGWVKDFFF